MDISQRSYKKELLDGENIPFEDIRRNMEELDFINTYLGGHGITLGGIKKLLVNSLLNTDQEYVICEIGCGGGDNMMAIQKWCTGNKVRARFVGIDINPNCIEVAITKLNDAHATFIVADYASVQFNEKPDYIFSSLFCHHFNDKELVSMLGWMKHNSLKGFFINDLQRHRLAYYAIKLLTRLFSKSYLVKNDAPLSVLRGFKKDEWTNLLKSAGISHYTIQWRWAFRFLITVKNNVAANG